MQQLHEETGSQEQEGEGKTRVKQMSNTLHLKAEQAKEPTAQGRVLNLEQKVIPEETLMQVFLPLSLFFLLLHHHQSRLNKH